MLWCAAEDFPRKKERSDGLDSYCKVCNCAATALRVQRKGPIAPNVVSKVCACYIEEGEIAKLEAQLPHLLNLPHHLPLPNLKSARVRGRSLLTSSATVRACIPPYHLALSIVKDKAGASPNFVSKVCACKPPQISYQF